MKKQHVKADSRFQLPSFKEIINLYGSEYQYLRQNPNSRYILLHNAEHITYGFGPDSMVQDIQNLISDRKLELNFRIRIITENTDFSKESIEKSVKPPGWFFRTKKRALEWWVKFFLPISNIPEEIRSTNHVDGLKDVCFDQSQYRTMLKKVSLYRKRFAFASVILPFFSAVVSFILGFKIAGFILVCVLGFSLARTIVLAIREGDNENDVIARNDEVYKSLFYHNLISAGIWLFLVAGFRELFTLKPKLDKVDKNVNKAWMQSRDVARNLERFIERNCVLQQQIYSFKDELDSMKEHFVKYGQQEDYERKSSAFEKNIDLIRSRIMYLNKIQKALYNLQSQLVDKKRFWDIIKRMEEKLVRLSEENLAQHYETANILQDIEHDYKSASMLGELAELISQANDSTRLEVVKENLLLAADDVKTMLSELRNVSEIAEFKIVSA